jgi:hypothetical protein
VTATAGNTQVTVSWTAVSGATSYNLYWSTTSGVTKANGNKISGVTSPYNHTGLINGTAYYYVVTAVNSTGESAASVAVTATPTAPIVTSVNVNVTPGTAAQGSLTPTSGTAYTFNFPATTVSQAVVVTIAATSFTLGSNDTYIQGFTISANKTISSFNVPVAISGNVGSTIPSGTVLNLAMQQNSTWVDVATVTVSAAGAFNENLLSTNLVGILAPGSYVLYNPNGSSTTVSNYGIALIADDGYGMPGDGGQNGLQVVQLYGKNGNILPTPTISYAVYPNAYDLDGEAITPDGSQGIMVDGGNTVRFFSGLQTGTVTPSSTTLDITSWGGDGDSVAIMPNGNVAVVSGDGNDELGIVSGIVSGNPVSAGTISLPDNRDGLLISNDGKVLLARGGSGLTVFSIGGSATSPTFNQTVNDATLGTNYYIEDGREGMAISPVNSKVAVIIDAGGNLTASLLTNLPTSTTESTISLTGVGYAYSVSITPDGTKAIVGTDTGLLILTGVNTGTLTQVGTTPYQPSYTVSGSSVTLGLVKTLAITLDGKYVAACDQSNGALVVIPIVGNGFGAPVAIAGPIAVPDNDQMVIH